MRAVSDAGPLIHLSWIDQIPILNQLYESLVVPLAVRDEVLAPPPGTRGLENLRQAFERGNILVALATDRNDAAALMAGLDVGEAEAIQLALALGADIFLTDDAAARTEAERRGIKVLGTVGVLTLARVDGLLPSAYPLVLQLRQQGQWLSNAIVEAVRTEETSGQH